jgi:hypothetical protein
MASYSSCRDANKVRLRSSEGELLTVESRQTAIDTHAERADADKGRQSGCENSHNSTTPATHGRSRRTANGDEQRLAGLC